MLLDILRIIGFAVGGAGVAILCNVLLLRFSKTLGIRNRNDVTIRWSNESKPSLGGVSFFVVFVFGTIAYSILFNESNIFQEKEFVGLFVACCLAFLMGLTDDSYNTKPLIKLFVQISCGVLFVISGSSIQLFDSMYLDTFVTIVWVVIVMNSLNMLDNMDGIAGTTVFFILLSCFFSGLIIAPLSSDIWHLIMAAIIGSVVGFLVMNVHPSKLFMGDAGSQFIGVFVAFFGMKYLCNVGLEMEGDYNAWLGLCVTLVAFTPTAVDSLTVFINRIKKGQSPMVGGKDHTTHHLVYKGFSDLKVWLVFVIIGIFSTIFSLIMVKLMSVGISLPVMFFVAYTLFVFFLLYRNTIKYPAAKKD